MLHSGHFEDLSVADAANTPVGEFADQGLATWILDELTSSLEDEEMKLTRSERQKLQRFYLSTIDSRLRSRLRQRVPRSGSE